MWDHAPKIHAWEPDPSHAPATILHRPTTERIATNLSLAPAPQKIATQILENVQVRPKFQNILADDD